MPSLSLIISSQAWTFLSSNLILYRKQTQKFNFPNDEKGHFKLASNSHNSAIWENSSILFEYLIVPFFSQMTIKSSTVPFCNSLPKGFVKSKEVNTPHEYLAGYQVPNTEYLWKFTVLI